jgi:hypothetical protein
MDFLQLEVKLCYMVDISYLRGVGYARNLMEARASYPMTWKALRHTDHLAIGLAIDFDYFSSVPVLFYPYVV